MYPNHHKNSMLSHRGMGLVLKMHRLKGTGYGMGHKQIESMSGSGYKKMEGGAVKKSRKPLSFRF